MADAPRFLAYAPDGPKAERFDHVAEAVAEAVVARGVEGVTIAAVARGAGVSRAWIYKYVGRDVSAVVAHAATHFGTAFADLDGPVERFDDVGAWRRHIVARTLKGIDDVERAPWAIRAYVVLRHRADPIGQALRDVEARNLGRFVEGMPPGMVGNAERGSVALLFQLARVALYHRWSDPRTRDDADAGALVEVLVGRFFG